MRGADYVPPGEYDGNSPRSDWSETAGEHYNLRDVEAGGGWLNDPRPLWQRLGDVLARGAITLALSLAVIALLAFTVDRAS